MKRALPTAPLSGGKHHMFEFLFGLLFKTMALGKGEASSQATECQCPHCQARRAGSWRTKSVPVWNEEAGRIEIRKRDGV